MELFALPLFAMPCLFFILVAGLMVVMIVVGQRQREQRQQAMGDLGREMGLHYDPAKDRSFDERYPFFNALKRGNSRYAYNILRGAFEGRNIVGFDYHYQTSSTDSKGKRRTTNHHFSAVIFEVGLPIHGLTIRPEGVFDRMKQFFGFDDIDFESAEFSRAFHVACKDRQLAYDVIQPETMDIMLQRPRFYLHFDQGLVMVFRGSRFKPDDYRAAIHLVDDILDRIPGSAREQLEMRR